MAEQDTEAKFCEVIYSKGIQDWTTNVAADEDFGL